MHRYMINAVSFAGNTICNVAAAFLSGPAAVVSRQLVAQTRKRWGADNTSHRPSRTRVINVRSARSARRTA